MPVPAARALAADDTPMLDVLVDLVATLDGREGYRADVVVLLQPTSPFRRAEHIDAAVDLLTVVRGRFGRHRRARAAPVHARRR